MKNELEEFCEELDISNHVMFLGARTDVPALLKESDIVVLATMHDNHPYVIMEAQVAGKAIVASDVGGISEMINDRETGLLFENQNSLELAEKLLEVMNNIKLRRQLEINSMEWGNRQWSSNVMYEQTMGIYNEVLKRTVHKSVY